MTGVTASRMPGRTVVYGAGAIGCWIGGRLSAGGADVTLVGRSRVVDELGDGLRLSELGGLTRTARPRCATEPSAARGADIVVVTVKSAGTAEAGREIARELDRPTLIVSLQNGVRNVETLRATLPGHTVVAGMVPFNVIRAGTGHYHRASAGTIMFEPAPAFAAMVRAAELAYDERTDMPAVQWGKLLLNLNNAINALSGKPLAAELGDHAYRRCLAAAQDEALAILGAAQVSIARVTAVPPRLVPRLLRLPDVVFRVLARRIVAIDPTARSSMWDDLEAGRPTEVDYIQGEVVRQAAELGRKAPVNAALMALVREAEAGGRRDYSGDELAGRLGLRR